MSELEELKKLIAALGGRIDDLEEKLGRSKRDRRRIREALEKLVQQEKSARGQFDFGAILRILDGDDEGGRDE